MSPDEAREHLMREFGLTRWHANSWLMSVRHAPAHVSEFHAPDGRAVLVTGRPSGKRNKSGQVWDYEIN